jgi:hypothetical protein
MFVERKYNIRMPLSVHFELLNPNSKMETKISFIQPTLILNHSASLEPNKNSNDGIISRRSSWQMELLKIIKIVLMPGQQK